MRSIKEQSNSFHDHCSQLSDLRTWPPEMRTKHNGDGIFINVDSESHPPSSAHHHNHHHHNHNHNHNHNHHHHHHHLDHRGVCGSRQRYQFDCNDKRAKLKKHLQFSSKVDEPTRVCLISLTDEHYLNQQSLLLISTLIMMILSSSILGGSCNYQPLAGRLKSTDLSSSLSLEEPESKLLSAFDRRILAGSRPIVAAGERKTSDNNSEQQQWKTKERADHDIVDRRQPQSSEYEEINGISNKIAGDGTIVANYEVLTTYGGLVPVNALESNNSSSVATSDYHRSGRSKRSTLESSADQQAKQLQRPFVDCRRLDGFWEFLSNSYPALSDYLFSLALGQLEATARNNHKSISNELRQTLKVIGQLLSEADRLVRQESIIQMMTAKLDSTHTAGQQPANELHLLAGSKANAWLARVAANPAYARIIQQHFSQSRPLLARHRFSKNNHDDGGASTPRPLTDTGSDPAGNIESGASYGRVAHYPHELERDSASKTLDKLHTLNNNHNQPSSERKQQLSDLRLTNEIGSGRPFNPSPSPSSSSSSSSSGEAGASEVESNQIPLIESESNDDSPVVTSREKTPTSSSGTSKVNERPRYVYGNVLLRPSQVKIAGAKLDDGGQPTDRLRKYNWRHNNYHNQRIGQADKLPIETNTYGQLVVGPQLSTPDRDQTSRISFAGDLSNNKQQSPSKSDDEHRMGKTSGSLNKPMDQLEPSQFGFVTSEGSQNEQQQSLLPPSSSSSLSQGDADELATQQNAGSMGAIESQSETGGGSGSGSSSGSQLENEFEGFWHSGPLEHVEATRQVRQESSSSGAYNEANGNEHPANLLRLTSSSPGQVLLVK